MAPSGALQNEIFQTKTLLNKKKAYLKDKLFLILQHLS